MLSEYTIKLFYVVSKSRLHVLVDPWPLRNNNYKRQIYLKGNLAQTNSFETPIIIMIIDIRVVSVRNSYQKLRYYNNTLKMESVQL